MQAGYFSTAAVDVLRGQMPNIPELDLPPEKLQTYDRLQQTFNAELIAEVDRMANVPAAYRVPSARDASANAAQAKAISDANVADAQAKKSAAAAATQAATTQPDVVKQALQDQYNAAASNLNYLTSLQAKNNVYQTTTDNTLADAQDAATQQDKLAKTEPATTGRWGVGEAVASACGWYGLEAFRRRTLIPSA